MNRVVYEFQCGRYHVLKVDGDMPTHPYNSYRIEGIDYKPVPVYDAPNCIAVESTDCFLGKFVEFV